MGTDAQGDSRSALAAHVRTGHALGWSFTPLAGKRPVLRAWQSAPRETLEQALAWAAAGNVGLRTGQASGGLIVIDLDTAKSYYDQDKVKALGLAKDTVIAVTGSGGYHLYYQLPDTVIVGNHTGKVDDYHLAPAVDYKSTGGQVVLPGSIHPGDPEIPGGGPAKGKPYRWMPGHSPAEIAVRPIQSHVLRLIVEHGGDMPEAPAPPGQIEPADKPAAKAKPAGESRQDLYGRRALADEIARLSAVGPGGRGSELNKAAFALGQLVAGGLLQEDHVKAGLLAACMANGLVNKDGRKDVEYHIDKSLQAGMKQPRSVPPPPTGGGRGAPPLGHSAPAAGGEDEPPRDDAGRVALGQVDPGSGRLILSPRRTLPTARAYVRQFATWVEPQDPPAPPAEGQPPPESQRARRLRTLHSYGGQLLTWQDNHYVEIEPGAVAGRLLGWLHAARMYVDRRGELQLVPFEANPASVEAALKSITFYVHLPGDRAVPFWISHPPDGQADERPDPREVLSCRSGNLHLPREEWLPATPDLFTTTALDYDYDPDAPEPVAWLRFLSELWGDDRQSIELLQEWFGYSLTPDNCHGKMLLLVGPRRCGKGTIGRVLGALVGRGNVAGPTTESLAAQFGLQQLIGKTLAIVSDARFTGPGIPTLVERLLVISGQDLVTIERKFLPHVDLTLPVRFVFLSNELPRFADASGALVGRFLILRLTESFYGREDIALTDRLLGELPGILRWAIEGWHRLRARGRFSEPDASAELKSALLDIASPVSQFVRERCLQAPSESVSVEAIYTAYRSWCEGEGRQHAPTRQQFGRDLNAAFPHLVIRRNHATGRFYQGLALKDPPAGEAAAPPLLDGQEDLPV